MRCKCLERYRRNKKVILLFLLPALLIYVVLEVVPVIQSFYFSFFDWPGIQGVPLKYVGLDNFISVFQNSQFHQAVKNILPALCNEFISLLKETSISGYIGLMDLTKGGDIIRSVTYEAFMPLIAVALIYLIMVMGLSKVVNLLERKLRSNER